MITVTGGVVCWRPSLRLESNLILHQSDLSALSRCAAAYGYRRAGVPDKTNSAAVFGTVVHDALHWLERERSLGRPFEECVQGATARFLHYWNPMNIEALTDPVPADGWLPRQGYSELRVRGASTIASYADLIRYDDHQLLAIEFGFMVPIEGTWDDELGEPHMLGGSVDRLAVRHYKRIQYLAVDDWKDLDVNTPISTPSGWTTMGALQVGEQVFGADGRPCAVTAKSKVYTDRPCFRVRFDDGTEVVAGDQHKWQVQTGAKADRTEVLTTEQLAQRIFSTAGSPQRDLRILNAEPLQLPEAVLPIHPYVLGAWLGDGSSRAGEVCKPDDEMFEHIKSCGYQVLPAQADGLIRTITGLREQLRHADLLGNKHVPRAYLRGSYAQRLALLQGLMDTDGTWNRIRHQAVFTSVDKQLAEDVRELVVSLGAKARVWELTKHGFGLTITAYDVSFSPTDWNPFRLSRKADLVRVGTTRARRRLIVSVEPTVSVSTQCITVDSPDSLYLCGEQMVPTHNTGKDYVRLRQNLQFTAYAYATTRPEFWMGYRGEDGFGKERGLALHKQMEDWGRRGTWINLRQFKFQDAGWRGPIDYGRFVLAVEQFAAMVKADVFPLTINGEVCKYCDYRDVCGGTGIALEDHGKPAGIR